MCGLCGVLGGERHWTERAASPGIFEAADGVSGRNRVTPARERQERVRLVNRVLDPMGLGLSEWSASSYVLRTKTGRSELVSSLGDLWPAVERLLGRPCDPLDPNLLSRMAR